MNKLKSFLTVTICVFIFSASGICQCREKSADLVSGQNLRSQLNDVLKLSIPEYTNLSSLVDSYFIYDLTEPSNTYRFSNYRQAEDGCLSFVNNHIYHFSVIYFPFSRSHIAFFKDGKFKVFKNINCGDSNDNLESAISYAKTTLKIDKTRDEVLIRLENYRRYGFYQATDEDRVACNSDRKIPQNSDKLYDRWKVIDQFSEVLRGSVSKKISEQLSWRFFIEEERANGFFVWDLTEPTNKQTSLLERVEFKNNHIYHFAFIDAPFSFSNIAVLEDGKLKFFKNINCSGKGESLKDVIGYLNQKLETNQNKKEILKRVKNYRKFGVYASYNGLSKPQCKEAIKI